MARTLELARFTVKPENVPALLASRRDVLEALRTFPGFIDVHLGRIDETTWIDVGLWESLTHAEAAAAKAGANSALARFFSLIDQTVAFEHAEVVEVESVPTATASRA